jgi:hypothetical protein
MREEWRFYVWGEGGRTRMRLESVAFGARSLEEWEDSEDTTVYNEATKVTKTNEEKIHSAARWSEFLQSLK